MKGHPVAGDPSPAWPSGETPAEAMDLRGVKCPLNWARAKVRLEDLPAGSILELIVDDARAVRDIPRAAEAHGHAVVGVNRLAPDGPEGTAVQAWRIRIER